MAPRRKKLAPKTSPLPTIRCLVLYFLEAVGSELPLKRGGTSTQKGSSCSDFPYSRTEIEKTTMDSSVATACAALGLVCWAVQKAPQKTPPSSNAGWRTWALFAGLSMSVKALVEATRLSDKRRRRKYDARRRMQDEWKVGSKEEKLNLGTGRESGLVIREFRVEDSQRVRDIWSAGLNQTVESFGPLLRSVFSAFVISLGFSLLYWLYSTTLP
jgi:hypothetical protein